MSNSSDQFWLQVITTLLVEIVAGVIVLLIDRVFNSHAKLLTHSNVNNPQIINVNQDSELTSTDFYRYIGLVLLGSISYIMTTFTLITLIDNYAKENSSSFFAFFAPFLSADVTIVFWLLSGSIINAICGVNIERIFKGRFDPYRRRLLFYAILSTFIAIIGPCIVGIIVFVLVFYAMATTDSPYVTTSTKSNNKPNE